MIYLPNPMIGARGIHEAIVTAFGQQPSHLGLGRPIMFDAAVDLS